MKKSLGQGLIQGLKEALDHAKGKLRLRESRRETISVMVPMDVKDRLEKVAQMTNLSVSKVAEVLVTIEALKAMEEYESKPVELSVKPKKKAPKKKKKAVKKTSKKKGI